MLCSSLGVMSMSFSKSLSPLPIPFTRSLHFILMREVTVPWHSSLRGKQLCMHAYTNHNLYVCHEGLPAKVVTCEWQSVLAVLCCSLLHGPVDLYWLLSYVEGVDWGNLPYLSDWFRVGCNADSEWVCLLYCLWVLCDSTHSSMPVLIDWYVLLYMMT